MLRLGRVDDGTMEFKAAPGGATPMQGGFGMPERMRLEDREQHHYQGTINAEGEPVISKINC